MTDTETLLSAGAPAPAKADRRHADAAPLAREAFFGRVSLDRMIDRFFEGEAAR